MAGKEYYQMLNKIKSIGSRWLAAIRLVLAWHLKPSSSSLLCVFARWDEITAGHSKDYEVLERKRVARWLSLCVQAGLLRVKPSHTEQAGPTWNGCELTKRGQRRVRRLRHRRILAERLLCSLHGGLSRLRAMIDRVPLIGRARAFVVRGLSVLVHGRREYPCVQEHEFRYDYRDEWSPRVKSRGTCSCGWHGRWQRNHKLAFEAYRRHIVARLGDGGHRVEHVHCERCSFSGTERIPLGTLIEANSCPMPRCQAHLRPSRGFEREIALRVRESSLPSPREPRVANRRPDLLLRRRPID
jgi:hypothetical protein